VRRGIGFGGVALAAKQRETFLTRYDRLLNGILSPRNLSH
jgi:hypothetical protein